MGRLPAAFTFRCSIIYGADNAKQISHLAGSAITRQAAWHGQGSVTEGTLPAREAFETADALFTVEKRELQLPVRRVNELFDDGSRAEQLFYEAIRHLRCRQN